MNNAKLTGAADLGGDREAALRQRETDDLTALLDEAPVDCGASGVWWCFTREPIAEEADAIQPGGVVVVGANARGLNLIVTRTFVRRMDGDPAPLDRVRLSAQLRSGDCVIVGRVPESKLRPALNVRLSMTLNTAPGPAALREFLI